MFFCDLETERLNLKNISTHDREFIFRQFSDDTITKYLFDEESLNSIDGADKIIKMYCIVCKKHNEC